MINYRSSSSYNKKCDLYYIPVSTTNITKMSEYTLYLGAAFLLGASILTTQFLFNNTDSDALRAPAEIMHQHEQYSSGLSIQPIRD